MHTPSRLHKFCLPFGKESKTFLTTSFFKSVAFRISYITYADIKHHLVDSVNFNIGQVRFVNTLDLHMLVLKECNAKEHAAEMPIS